MDKTAQIRRLNDNFRTSFIGGRINITCGIQALGEDSVADILQQVRTFNNFTKGNDPYAEHDFGSFEYNGHKIFWKIDYYDKNLEFGSEDASDETITTRVLTIMLANEY